ncbi:hypothetical protein BV898_09571 [Hypsibius exemplaris]|uniref:F-box domain-containing protein n=1 Tax=Hypsibius exemplaris TaxID=2072580 RepID=A0A1W0WMB4_HYPEX|nr:hypothetical protein BV898_09571 [Hypsibius exemplaris]
MSDPPSLPTVPAAGNANVKDATATSASGQEEVLPTQSAPPGPSGIPGKRKTLLESGNLDKKAKKDPDDELNSVLMQLREKEEQRERIRAHLRRTYSDEQKRLAIKQRLERDLQSLREEVTRREEELAQYEEEMSMEADEFPGKIEKLKADLMANSAEAARLRYWGDRKEIIDFPDELLCELLQFLNFPNQSRLQRTSKLWRRVLLSQNVTRHAYLELTKERLANAVPREWDGYGFPPPLVPCELASMRNPSIIPKRAFSLLRQMTFVLPLRGQLHDVELIGQYVSAFAASCVKLEVVIMLNLRLERGTAFREFISKFVRPATTAPSNGPKVTGRHLIVKNLFKLALAPEGIKQIASPSVTDWYVRIPELTISSVDDFEQAVDRLLWPFPDEQLEWLARYAQRVRVTVKPDQRLKVDPCSHSSPSRIELCEHLGVGFYKQLTGQLRAILALMILEKVSNVKPPPVEFVFDKYRFGENSTPYKVSASGSRHSVRKP